MGKSIRSKIKRYWRSELRNTVGVAYLAKQEEKIQIELKKAIESQGPSSIVNLKQQLFSTVDPNVSKDMVVDSNPMKTVQVPTKNVKAPKKTIAQRKKAGSRKKFVHFYSVGKALKKK